MATLTRPARTSDAPALADPGPAPAPFSDADRAAISASETEGVAAVQRSVLDTLADLLAPREASRRHSMPASNLSPLRNLVNSLRDGESESGDDGALLAELAERVDAAPLPGLDGALARALARLLLPLHALARAGLSPSGDDLAASQAAGGDSYAALSAQLAALQMRRPADAPDGALPPVQAVQRALLWSRLDSALDAVQRAVRARAAAGSPTSPVFVDGPPAYMDDRASITSGEKPPVYEDGTAPRTSVSDEKMRMDLEGVASAIDRLYTLVPQLHSQRAELRVRTPAPAPPSAKGKARATEDDDDGLDDMLALINRASTRRLADQSAHMDSSVMARARERSEAQRDAFVGKLAAHSEARRIVGQDAAPPRPRDPEERLLTFPEFIRESAALAPPPQPRAKTPPSASGSTRSRMKTLRARSMSAPALSWFLRPSSSSGPSTSRLRPSTPGSSDELSEEPELEETSIAYIAEHHAALRHVLAFVAGAPAGATTEVRGGALHIGGARLPLPAHVADARTTPAAQTSGGTLEFKLPVSSSAPLSLSRSSSRRSASRGKTPDPVIDDEDDDGPLLGAAALAALRPHTLACAGCSLPLARPPPDAAYDDLPSEHWAELVDAWMCHGDMALSERVARHARGVWPRRGQVLVGGSYVLVGQAEVVEGALRVGEPQPGEDWRSVRCKCGTYSGRVQDVTLDGAPSTVYRLAKYALRPMSAHAEPPRIPLSAFVLADMDELAAAHAAYRVVVRDEEEARPRLLLWLFKPRLRLAYALPAHRHYLLPAHSQKTVRAAKVLYKILGPELRGADLARVVERYPGFPQAEVLVYPKDVCTRVAALLKESSLCYPEHLRTMTGLDVGWLLRA